MNKYICTRDWYRCKKGDILEHWEYKRFPADIRESHFKPYKESKPKATPKSKMKPTVIKEDKKEPKKFG